MWARPWDGRINSGWWGEEIKFYLDDDKYPTICGTGTEDYFGDLTTGCRQRISDIAPFSWYTSGCQATAPITAQCIVGMLWSRPVQNLQVTIWALGWRGGGVIIRYARYILGCLLVSNSKLRQPLPERDELKSFKVPLASPCNKQNMLRVIDKTTAKTIVHRSFAGNRNRFYARLR